VLGVARELKRFRGQRYGQDQYCCGPLGIAAIKIRT
jgi:hypothetical protein